MWVNLDDVKDALMHAPRAIRYWGEVKSSSWPDKAMLIEHTTIKPGSIQELKGQTSITSVSLQDAAHALGKLITGYPNHYAKFKSGQWDDEMVDVWMQLAVFGITIYG